jgi:hypothetical protein
MSGGSIRNNDGVETVGLSVGDTDWVFPAGSVTGDMAAVLDRSGERLRGVAAGLGKGRAGWTGEGLEYWLLPSGQRSLGGFAENAQVTFLVELRPPGFYGGADGWSVEAEIAVRCDHRADCGMHRIEFREASELDTPADAVATLDEFTGWLMARGREVSPADWRARDPLAARE